MLVVLQVEMQVQLLDRQPVDCSLDCFTCPPPPPPVTTTPKKQCWWVVVLQDDATDATIPSPDNDVFPPLPRTLLS